MAAIKKAKKVRVRKVVLKPAQAVRIVADPKALPIVAHVAPNVVDVVAVDRPKATKKMGWMEYLFG